MKYADEGSSDSGLDEWEKVRLARADQWRGSTETGAGRLITVEALSATQRVNSDIEASPQLRGEAQHGSSAAARAVAGRNQNGARQMTAIAT